MAQLVVVDQVLVAQRDPEDALANQRLDRVLDQLRRRASLKQPAKRSIQPDRPIGRPQQQRAGIRRDPPPSKAATTARPSTGANSNNSALHSVGIGALLESALSLCSQNNFR